jgi:hypothetical protein
MPKRSPAAGMIKYLANRKCPRCHRTFIVVLLDRSLWVKSVNGFCGVCDHSISWQLIRGNAAIESRSRLRAFGSVR